jgi:hypothetical protein
MDDDVEDGEEDEEFLVVIWASLGGFIFRTIFPGFFVDSSGVVCCFFVVVVFLTFCSLLEFLDFEEFASNCFEDFVGCSDDSF